MPRRSRRALLAAAVTGFAGVAAGCGAPSNSSRTAESPARRLRGKSIFVADAVTIRVDDVRRVNDPTDADLAVFAATEDEETVRSALAAETIVAVVGEDARLTVERACDADGRSYGFCSDSWSADMNVVAAVPHSTRLETHVYTDVSVPDELPWALGETFSTGGSDCAGIDSLAAVPANAADSLTPVGASRIRSRTRPGGFDRWDRVQVATGPKRAWLVLETTATIVGGRDGFDADTVRLVDHFDQRLEGVDTAAHPADKVEIRTRGDRSEDAADHSFHPTSDAAHRSFTACQRAVVTVPELPEPFSYTANGRFRWRNPGFFDDDHWHHHTPGQAMWYLRPSDPFRR
ncbi:hypothetical protein [Natrinema sp. SYSU A 869]|uniref:hypothetical protein n=1 Tax=Natrinema sp. SYSU A 869 TaxID=2871694 RepID=UPI001CA3B615|nr:hypothetical protein [Natrinema sp. SYSU A 869]